MLHERGIQSSCDGKAKRKAELAELAFNARKMKLPKVSDGESENMNTVIAELLRTDEGILATPALVNNWSKSLSLFSEVTFPDIICLERLTNIQRKVSSHSRASLGIGCL